MTSMQPTLAFLLLLAPALASAETLALPVAAEPATQASSALPLRGEAQAQVLARFGAPRQRHAAVGGDSPRHPPITRWDYADFSVFFENDHVVDAVRPDAPAPLASRAGLVGNP